MTIKELLDTEVSNSLVAQSSLKEGHKSIRQVTFLNENAPSETIVIYKVWAIDQHVLETKDITKAIEKYNEY